METDKPTSFAACNGPCEQGRQPCPCPDSCRISVDDAGTQVGLGVALCALAALVVILCILAGFLYAGGLQRLFNWMLS